MDDMATGEAVLLDGLKLVEEVDVVELVKWLIELD